MIDHVTARYLAEGEAPASPLRDAVAAASYPELFFASCGKRLLSRPFFVEEAEIRGMAERVIGIFDLLVSLPDRLFDGDIGKFCASLGIDERRAALMQRFGGRTPTLYGRADLYHDGNAFKMLEFNLGSQLGGADRAEISRALTDVPAFREFAEREKLNYVYTGERMAETIRAAARPVTGNRQPVVALIEADGGLAPYLHLVKSFQEMMIRIGLDFRIGEISQLKTTKDGKLSLDGTPLDLVLRYFSVDQLCEVPNGEEIAEPVFRAHDEGKTVLLTTTESFLYGNKATLAMLSDPRWRGHFSATEAALIDEVLPVTRTLAEGPVDIDGETVELMDYCRHNRERLILKPSGHFGGGGIHVGWQLDEAAWQAALSQAQGQAYVVQQRVFPRHEPVRDPDTGELEDWLAAWDVFLTPDGYAGSHIRALPVGDSAIIGMGASPRARTTGVFNYPSLA